MNFVKMYFKTILGLTAIVLGIVGISLGTSVSYNGIHELDKSYGGDAYTGIQNAAATTANNVNDLGDAYIESYEHFMIFVGLLFIAGGALSVVYNVADVSSNEKKTFVENA